MPRPRKTSKILPMLCTGNAARVPVGRAACPWAAARRNRGDSAVRVKRAGRADEGPRDHPAHFVRAAQNLARGLADLVQLPQRDHFFVRGHLENAVGRGVDDGRAGAHVLGAQFLDDLGAGSGLVAERAAADAALEFVHDLGRKAVRDRAGTASSRWMPDHLPMAGGRVLAGRGQGAAPVSARRRDCAAAMSGQRLDVAQPEPRQIGQAAGRAGARCCRGCRLPAGRRTRRRPASRRSLRCRERSR